MQLHRIFLISGFQKHILVGMFFSGRMSLSVIEVFVMVPVAWMQMHCKAISVVENIHWIDLNVFIVL